MTLCFVLKTDFGSKVATFSFPTTGIVTHLQLGDLKAIGAHNHSNAAVAAFSVLGLDVGIDCDFIKSTVGILSILPHRMQVGQFAKFFNMVGLCSIMKFVLNY